MLDTIVYNIFGSSDSLDYDIAVKVNSLSSIEKNKKLISSVEEQFKEKFSDKPLNCNLVIVKNNMIVECHKGTPDEVNNSVLRTYSFHKQEFPCFVSKLDSRDRLLKILRATRTILSFCSRTPFREIIKDALKSNYSVQFEVLSNLPIIKIYEAGLGNTKNITMKHFLKKSAFQIVQVLGLISDNFEYYTKQEIVYEYPLLYNIMYEQNISTNDVVYLQGLLGKMLSLIKDNYWDYVHNTREVNKKVVYFD